VNFIALFISEKTIIIGLYSLPGGDRISRKLLAVSTQYQNLKTVGRREKDGERKLYTGIALYIA